MRLGAILICGTCAVAAASLVSTLSVRDTPEVGVKTEAPEVARTSVPAIQPQASSRNMTSNSSRVAYESAPRRNSAEPTTSEPVHEKTLRALTM
jgi:hypothetical protein